MLDVKGQSHAEILVARRSSPAGLRTVWDAGGKTWLRLLPASPLRKWLVSSVGIDLPGHLLPGRLAAARVQLLGPGAKGRLKPDVGAGWCG